MQWLLQDFEDTEKLGEVLLAMGRDISWHKIVPFVGDLTPAPLIKDPRSVVMFGAYSMWKYAEAQGLQPGVIRIAPFLDQEVWHPFLLNGPEARVMRFADCPAFLCDPAQYWFLRPVEDSKEIPGRVMQAGEIAQLAQRVSNLPEEQLPIGSLRPDTNVMFSAPKEIDTEWRLWIVDDQLVTYSRYKQAGRVDYVHDITEEALRFGREMAQKNAGYASAYVMDVCQIGDIHHIIETNSINAAGFYAADLTKLVHAIEALFTEA
ncbi:ATP-grasp domain-containing protein [Shimia sp. R9_1]|uniref:ATP-grasp domain-containing protein n=1 Tax=Shimia sp. R9_1 TaxID=2821111 RepID=UPI001ADB44ED|nr:ATP-grasp domain-containing protein [Shimia sp. R9_1]MBO9406029.1 ATP-grasp domain-containing protein [Shimia sp. R9_1]